MVPIVRPQPQTILQLDAVSSMLGPGALRSARVREKSGIDLPICSTHAILTAHHVLQVLPKHGRVGLILSPTLHQHTVDTQALVYREIARGTIDSEGPDLGAVILAPSIAAAIAAKKTFYNLDSRREQLLHTPPDLHVGGVVNPPESGDEKSIIRLRSKHYDCPPPPSRHAVLDVMYLNGQKIVYRGNSGSHRASTMSACFPRTLKNTRVSIPVYSPRLQLT